MSVVPDQSPGPYWSVDLPGLTASGADEILAFASTKKLVADGGSAVDPRSWFTSHLAIDGARRLANILQLVTNGCIETDADDTLLVNGLVDQITDWITEVEQL